MCLLDIPTNVFDDDSNVFNKLYLIYYLLGLFVVGEKFINGRLRQMDIYVRRSTLRETIKAVAGTRPRPGRLRRREYYVRAPLSLVHLDGNHKLIR